MSISPVLSTDRVATQQFQQLLELSHPISISIYLPADDEVGLEPTMRRSRLKNLEQQALAQVKKIQPSHQDLSQLRQQFETIKNTEKLWQIGPHGFAIFVSPDHASVYALPMPVSMTAQVSPRFHLKPLIKLLTEPMNFFLLSITKKSTSLFKGDVYSLTKLTVPELPENMEEVVGVEVSGRNVQFQTGSTGSGSGKRPAIFHGNSSWKDDKHLYLEKYLQRIDTVVCDYLKTAKEPLLLAGQERTITTFFDVAKYKHLVRDTYIRDKADIMSASELHQTALEQLEPIFLEKEVAKVQQEIDTGDAARFSLSVDEILRQGYQGKIDTLLVAQGRREWGIFKPESMSVQRTQQPSTDAQDLLEVASIETIKNGGKVYVLPPEKIPGNSEAAAVFRY